MYELWRGRPAVRFERAYAGSAERVWSAVTEPGELARWFPSSVTFEPRPGGTVRFSGDPNVADSEGTVLVFAPPTEFAFTWGGNDVHLEVRDDGAGRSRLTLVDVLSDASEAARNAAGWDVCLGVLDALLAGGDPAGPHSAAAADWQSRYDAYIQAGMPSGAAIPG
jgi:uncharacterized protein YndB with AHSA1/START domain